MILNFFPLTFNFDSYQINTEPYSIERLKELRGKYNSTHSFFRSDDEIYISKNENLENLNLGNIKDVTVYDNHEITSSLIKHIFFRNFLARFSSYIPIDFYPFRFYSKNVSDDIIHSILPDNLKNIIAYKKLIEVQLRLLTINGEQKFGFIINCRRNWVFEKSCAELKNENFNFIGMEVIHSEVISGLENILAPNEEFVGFVTEISDDKAQVSTNEGNIEYPLTELYLRKTKFNIESYLNFSISQEKTLQLFKVVNDKKIEINNPKKNYNDLISIAKILFSTKDEINNPIPVLFQNKDNFCFTVDSNPITVTNSISLKTPTFIFDYAATKTQANYPDIGLNNFGPYDSLTFDIKEPVLLCICHKDNRGSYTSFLASLKDGLPNSKYFKKGFPKKYDLKNVQINLEEITNYDLQEYLKILRNNETKPDLAIIEIPDSFRKLADKDNPYYKIKAKLLSLEIPVQFITNSKIMRFDEFILNSIGLQLYAKLGGTPWVLPSNRSIDREIIIGIGHSWIRENQYKGTELNRVVGITTFFSSDGQYLLGDKVKDVSYNEYFDELIKSLRLSFKNLEKEQGWKEDDTIRLIFHIFKPIKNVEFDVISQLIKEFEKYKIQFAFVTISDMHPFLLFNPAQKGVPKYYGSAELKGEYIPDRSNNVFIDSTTCLLQMFGAKELKTNRHGMTPPIQIKIRTPQTNNENSLIDKYLFTDLSYIVQQIYSFSYLSWRSFLPHQLPATMLYSNLIAKILGKLRNIEGWDSDNLNYKLKRKKWFL